MTDKEFPDAYYRHVPLDITIKDGSELLSDIRALAHIDYAMTAAREHIANLTKQCEADSLTCDRKVSRDVGVSRVTAVRRAAVPGEEAFVDWTIPDTSKQVVRNVHRSPDPAADLEKEYAELAKLAELHTQTGQNIDDAVREMKSVPSRVPGYRAWSTSGKSGWKLQSFPSRTITIEYRAYS